MHRSSGPVASTVRRVLLLLLLVVNGTMSWQTSSRRAYRAMPPATRRLAVMRQTAPLRTKVAAGLTPLAPPVLRLSPDEATLFKLLNDVALCNGTNTTLRVAGGWVRDKVLASYVVPAAGRAAAAPPLESANRDIDIALDNQTGTEFANRVKAWLEAHGDGDVRVGTIQRNPDRSKHLETATMTVLGFSVDFVNLRTEEYCLYSRIPAARFGNPYEDASRRDFTINSLFLNLRSWRLEDLTGRGLADLARKVVATPLAPRETLLDDPLRLLRAARFAARLGFGLCGDLAAAAALPEVRAALAAKVSRERIGRELDQMLYLAPPQLLTRRPCARGVAADNSTGGSKDDTPCETLCETPCDAACDTAWDAAMRGPARAVRLLHTMGVLPIVLREPPALFRRPQPQTAAVPTFPPAPDWTVLEEPASEETACGGSAEKRCSAAAEAMELAQALLTSPRHYTLQEVLGLAPTAMEPTAVAPTAAADPAGDAEVRRLALLGCLLLPWADLETTAKCRHEAEAAGFPSPPAVPPVEPPVALPLPTLMGTIIGSVKGPTKGPTKALEASRYLCAGLKLSRRDRNHVAAVHAAAAALAALPFPRGADASTGASTDGDGGGDGAVRAAAGMALRAAGPWWRAAAVVGAVARAMRSSGAEQAGSEGARPLAKPEATDGATDGATDKAVDEASSHFAALAAWLHYEGLTGDTDGGTGGQSGGARVGAWAVRPVLDGGALRRALPGLGAGPGMRVATDAVLRWQMASRGAYEAAVRSTGAAEGGDSSSNVQRRCVAFLAEQFPKWAKGNGSDAPGACYSAPL